jgi:diketogulonate reductase-like aldo/keto reductase
MKRRTFGPTGELVAVIGQGTWQLEDADPQEVIRALRKGIDAGMTHIDTAEMYGSGVVEEMVGRAIEGRRREVFLASKVLPMNASLEGTVKACERSLKRLRTDWLDLYLLHWRSDHPLEQTITGFEQLKRVGKIRACGVSNFDVPDLEEVVAIAGENRIACNQVLYHLQERAIEHQVLPWCRKHRLAVVGYSPFGSGQFPSPQSPGGRVLAEIAGAHGATPRQVALCFLVREPNVFTIPRSSKAEHALENAGAGDLELSPTEIKRIDRAFPRGPKPAELPML